MMHPSQGVYRAGDGPPLVWLHSLYGVEADAGVIETLAQDHTVYAPMAPGFADLNELEAIRDIHELMLHYDDVFDTLNLDKFMLAGHSFGAMLAAEYAAHFPRRVQRLVLCSPLGLWNDAYPVADLFAVPQRQAPELLYVDSSSAPGGGAKPDIDQLIALVQGMTTVARFLWPIPDRGLARRLYRVRAPTLIVHGDRDAFVPHQYARDFAAALPNATVHIIRGAAHMLTVEALDETLQAMRPFLSQRVEAPV